jgi:hypothetical protein
MDATDILSADELCRLAADFACEHGDDAMDVARRQVLSLEAEGALDRARFWLAMCVLLDDIAEHRIDPLLPQTVH